MPYLGRRAIENKSVLGNGAAIEERRVALAQIQRILFIVSRKFWYSEEQAGMERIQ